MFSVGLTTVGTVKRPDPRPHPGQQEVHLQLGHAAPQTRPGPEAERDGAEGVHAGLLLRATQPALGQEGVRIGEDLLIVGRRVVTQVKQRLRTTGDTAAL